MGSISDEKTYESLFELGEVENDNATTSFSYIFKLDVFEGPLDILYELIRKSKLSIQEVRISEITEQYFEQVRDIEVRDLERITEFVVMAAILLEIKSKSLLPRVEEEEVAEDDTEQLLKQKLEEYKLFKEASQKMREQETVDIYFREPDTNFIERPRFCLKDMNKDRLMDALRKMFMKRELRAMAVVEREISLDRFTVDEKMHAIADFLEFKDSFLFSDLFDDDYSKSEIITTFQALLELMKLEIVRVEQDDIFSEIMIYKAGNTDKLDL